MLNKEIPFLRISVPLCTGIIAGRYFDPDTFIIIVLYTISLTGLLISLSFNRRPVNNFYGYPLTAALFVSGIVLYSNEKKTISSLEDRPGIYLTTVSDYPEPRGNHLRFTARLEQKITPSGNEQLKGSLLIYLKNDSSGFKYIPGDHLVIRCIPAPITNRGNPDEFDYRFYMENRGIKYSVYINKSDLLAASSPTYRKLSHRALIIREKIIDMYRKRGITGERLALVAAVTLGQKNMLDQEQKQIFINAGVMHIMAVSGLHAVILSLFVFNILFFLKGKLNSLRIIITILFLWSFAFVTGLTPSVLRATLMFTCLQAGNLMKREVNSINSVLASAFVLMLLRPSVIFDAGFLLSYSAVIFIICFYKEFYSLFDIKNIIADKIWQSAAVTIIAQAGTLSLTVSFFNRFPTWFIITNIVIVPLSSLLIIIGCLVPLTYPFVIISQKLALLLGYLTGFTEALTAAASSLPFSSISNIGMTPLACILFSCTMFLFFLYLLKKPRIPVRYPLIMAFLLVCLITIQDIATMRSAEIIVFNIPNTTTFGIRSGKKLALYSSEDIVPQDITRYCATHRISIKKKSLRKDTFRLNAGNTSILITPRLNKYLSESVNPDLVILTGSHPVIDKGTNLQGQISKIVVSPEIRGSIRFSENPALSGIDSLHFIKESGAYRLRL